MPKSVQPDPAPAKSAQAIPRGAAPAEPGYVYEPLERFGEGLTTRRPWNTQALAGVERLNGRVAMLGFMAAVLGEVLTGEGVVGQLLAMLRWLLGGTIA
jgi:hypothetical protein